MYLTVLALHPESTVAVVEGPANPEPARVRIASFIYLFPETVVERARLRSRSLHIRNNTIAQAEKQPVLHTPEFLL
jgi:hypothetical protein